jgi:5'-3' exonuclease
MYNLVDFDGYLIQAITATPWYKHHYELDTPPTEVNYVEGLIQTLAWYHNWLEEFTINFGTPELFISEKKKDKYHRHLLYPDYKANRSKYRNSVAVWRNLSEAFKGLMKQNVVNAPVHVLQGYEADDTVSIVASYIKKKEPKVRVNVHSIDKDLQTVPDIVMFSPTNPDGMYISEQVMNESIHYQMIVGDSTDGYGGLKGHGKKKYADFWADLSKDDFIMNYINESSKEHYDLMRALVCMLNINTARRIMSSTDYKKMMKICEVIYDRCKNSEENPT